jgi:hypothetical protein
MRYYIKILGIFFLIIFNLNLSPIAIADETPEENNLPQNQNIGVVANSAVDAIINPVTAPAAIAKGSMAALLCGFRWLFCGEIITVFVASSIFMMGIGILTQKLSWPFAFVMVTFIVILAYPEQITKMAIESAKLFGLEKTLAKFADVCVCSVQPPTIF